MLTSNVAPTVSPTAAATTTGSSASSTSQTGVLGANSIAGNFTEFLQLLTTQLQNQDPTSPLDPNQFTSELVQFASVEQQINTNTSLNTLISLQQTQEASSALGLIGATVAVSSNSAQLTNGQATWGYSVTQPATATINVTNSTGQIVFTTTQAAQPGNQSFTWNGQNAQGVALPAGTYTASITAVGANNQSVPVTTQVQGQVTAVNVSANPPTLTVNGQNFPLSQITQVLGSGSSSLTAPLTNATNALNSVTSQLGQLLSIL
jgi:flagellar basal-body rod modification protein FlgD